MKFSDRTYPDIVRDLLTLLTRGTVGESHVTGPTGTEAIVLDNGPVKRVSHVEGELELGDQVVPFRFSDRDFELVGTSENPKQLTTLRFRDGGKHPAPSSTVKVNYYPTRLKPTPLNDVNVGSVVRTLLETVAFEMAAQYQQLQRVYESAFVETAAGTSLDNVVALVDVARLRQGHPAGKVRFLRRSGAPGQITIPVNTAVGDGKGARYLTSEEGAMLPQQSSVDVWVHGETARTPTLAAGQLTVLERAIASVDRAVNEEDTFRLTEDEQDEPLASRARRAIHGSGRGTADAITFALQSLPFVSAVALTEYVDGVPGTLRVDVALTEDNTLRRAEVERQVRDFRPAGIMVSIGYAGRLELGVELELVLAGGSLPTSTIAEIKDGAAARIEALVKPLAPGAILRRARLVAAVLEDARIVDAKLALTADGAAVSADNFTLPGGKTVQIDRDHIRCEKVSFEDAAASTGPITVQVDAELAVVRAGGTTAPDLDDLKPRIQGLLAPLLANLQPGAALSFEAALAAVQDDDTYVVLPEQSALLFEEPSGGFTELRSGDPAYTLGAGATASVRKVTLKEGTEG